MTDPWPEVRKIIRRLKTKFMPDAYYQLAVPLVDTDALLTDADALLTMLPFSGHTDRCLRVNYGVDQECDCGYTKALAALPEHLRGDNDERSRKA